MTKVKLPVTLNNFMAIPKCDFLRVRVFSFFIFASLTSCGNANKKTIVLEDSVTIINTPTKKDSALNKSIETFKIVIKKDAPIRVYFK